MTDNRPIPQGQRRASAAMDFATSFSASFAASFRAGSPLIAQEALARDLAACSDSEDGSPERRGRDGHGRRRSSAADGDDDSSSACASDEDEDLLPPLYRKPSGIAFGTARPAVGPHQMLQADEPGLRGMTRAERKQSRDAERSLLRDNHLIPPKHPVVPSRQDSVLGRLYRRLFSTKVPRDDAGEGVQPSGVGAPSETAPLLATAPEDNGAAATTHEHLNRQWAAAVSTGQLRTTWQREAKTLAVYSRSLVVTFILQYSINIAAIFAVGRIGKVELGAVSLATMTANIMCYSPIQGLATSLDTLCAQAFGSGHKHLVGLQLQRMTWFLLLLLIPIAILFFHATEILAAMIPERRSAELAGVYLKVILFGTPGFIAFEGGKRFVMAQGLFQATTYVLLIAAPVNILLNWLFVWHFRWGYVGAPIAVAVTQNLLPVLLFLYVVFIDGSQCWGGFSKRALTNWGPMIWLAVPGMIMVEAEWFAFEVLTLAASQFGTSYLAAQSILGTVTSTTFQLLPFPMSIAASTRIANLIGAKLVAAAKTSAKVAFFANLLAGIINLTLIASLRYQIPRLFTQDSEVIEIVARVTPLCAVMQVFDGLAAVAHGMLRGVGRQGFGGWANLACYYLVALPISFGTAFGLDWQLEGLWLGVTVGLFLVATVEFWFLSRYDWERAAKEAENRNASA